MTLPKRVPGTHLMMEAVEPPGEGWFRDSVEWPTEDEDEHSKPHHQDVLKHYLDGSELPSGSDAADLLARVLNGIKLLNKDKSRSDGGIDLPSPDHPCFCNWAEDRRHRTTPPNFDIGDPS